MHESPREAYAWFHGPSAPHRPASCRALGVSDTHLWPAGHSAFTVCGLRTGDVWKSLRAPVSSPVSSQADDAPACRICFGDEPWGLICPCGCTGSSAFVHFSCLDAWRRTSTATGNLVKAASCDVCCQPFRVPGPRMSHAERAKCALQLSARLSLALWANGSLLSAVLGSALGAEAGLSLIGSGMSRLLAYVDHRVARDPVFAVAAALTLPAWAAALAVASHASIVASAVAGCVFGGLLGAFGIPILALRALVLGTSRAARLALYGTRALLALLL